MPYMHDMGKYTCSQYIEFSPLEVQDIRSNGLLDDPCNDFSPMPYLAIFCRAVLHWHSSNFMIFQAQISRYFMGGTSFPAISYLLFSPRTKIGEG